MGQIVLVLATDDTSGWNKYLAPIAGEPLIGRTLRQLDELRQYTVVVTQNPQIQEISRLHYNACRGPSGALLDARSLWADRTIVLAGDVVWPDKILNWVLGNDEFPKVFGDYGSVFGIAFLREHFDKISSALERTVLEGNGSLWQFYYALCGFENLRVKRWGEFFKVVPSSTTPNPAFTRILGHPRAYEKFLEDCPWAKEPLIPTKDWARNLTHNTLFGIHTLQTWTDMMLWEKFLGSHRGLRALIELGTFKGGFTAFLSLQAIQRGMKFYTFDIKRLFDGPLAKYLMFDQNFYEGDLFGEMQQVVIEILENDKNHPLLLYCDDGNKPREFQTFVPHLRAGDLVAVHDWNVEFKMIHAEPVRELIEPIFLGPCIAFDSKTRFWRRK